MYYCNTDIKYFTYFFKFVVPERSHTPPMEGPWIFLWEGGLNSQTFRRKA